MDKMTVICAWCNKVLREGSPYLPISHGMCEECKQRELAKIGVKSER